MEAFKNFKGIVAGLDRANVDTDQIIPKQFLKSIARTGFGKDLFFDWRYAPDGSPAADFPLNAERFKGASILVTGNNFGCGSSREHAVWAIQQDGFRALIAPSMESDGTCIPGFADIFRNNCGKNAVLAVELSAEEVRRIFDLIETTPGLEATVDLEKQCVIFHGREEVSFAFEIDSAVKHRLLNGLDDIGLTLEHDDAIRSFEKKHSPQLYR
ncbi:MAG: 3-isopropylmalate dehydratase small subunit [Candidatus Omnitrophota bacterium]|nr:3-isopropylmalate dehydratase small subunit [Candidatus Omnitrophota bacterium]